MARLCLLLHGGDLEVCVADLEAVAAGAGSPDGQHATVVRGQVRRAFGAGSASGVPVWRGRVGGTSGSGVERLRAEDGHRFRSLVRRVRTGPAEGAPEGSAADAHHAHDALAIPSVLHMTEGIAGWFRVGGPAIVRELEIGDASFALATAGVSGGGDVHEG